MCSVFSMNQTFGEALPDSPRFSPVSADALSCSHSRPVPPTLSPLPSLSLFGLENIFP